MTFPEKMRTVGVRYKRLFQCLDQDIHVPSILKIEESARYRIPMSNEYWQKTVNTLRHEVSKLDQKKVMVHINQIIRGIQWLDPIMTRYCEQTCPSCKDPCCTGYEVFFNQTDLLYLTAGHTKIPPGQTRTSKSETCRYLGEKGCRLPRLHRPYVCVWFICDAQMELLQSEPNVIYRQFIKTMQDIRMHRLALESLYELCPARN